MKKTLQVLGIIAIAAVIGLGFAGCSDPEPPAPVITITTQPAATTPVTAGSISGSLTVAASVTEGVELSFQWFSNTTASNVGGTERPNAVSASFIIPIDLAVGNHYFFVEVRASGAEPVRSNVARVNVGLAAPTVTGVSIDPPTASVARGQTRQFTATVSGDNNPAQTVTWEVTGGGGSTNIDADGILTVATNESATSLTVTATSTVDTSVSGTAVVTVAAPTVTSVEVSPSTASVVRGRTEQFTATVSGTGNPAQTVTWEVTGGGSGTSINADGLLTVAIDQAPATLTVTATSTVDTNKSGTAEVTVPAAIVSGVTVSPSTVSVARGQTRQFNATVSGTGHPAQTVTWTVEGGGSGTSIDTDGLLTVDENESATSLTVTARSTVDTNRSGTAEVTIPPTVTGVSVTPLTVSVIRGQQTTQQFTATVSGTGNPDQTVTWTVTGGGVGTNINATSGFFTVAANETANSLTVTATSTVDTSVSGTAEVTIIVPVINIITQPALTTTVTAGNISGSLTVGASVTQNAALSFQWFSNTTNSSTGGNAISGATSASFIIPIDLAVGNHYFFVEVRANGAEPVRSNVAVVNVALLPMVRIQPGSFWMGQREVAGATPVHQVTLTQGFYMGIHEVTQTLWCTVMAGNTNNISVNPSWFTGDRLPVESVSWYDVLVFANRLSMARGLEPAYSIGGSTNPDEWGEVPTSWNTTWDAVEVVANSTGYRLPTEAQWEYAARAGTTTQWSFGGMVNDAFMWFSQNSQSRTQEVGTRRANPWGLYDMHGNVWEWVWDRHGTYPGTAQTDPTGASSGTCRVVRGGSWNSTAENTRSANRSSLDPFGRFNSIGFRLVRPVVE